MLKGSGLRWRAVVLAALKFPRHVGSQVKNRNPILAKVYRKKMFYYFDYATGGQTFGFPIPDAAPPQTRRRKEARVLIEEDELDQRGMYGNFSKDLNIFLSSSIWLDFALRGLGKLLSSSTGCRNYFALMYFPF